MNLAKAMKVKNRKIKKISELQRDIQNNNSVIEAEGVKRKFDIDKLLVDLDNEVKELVNLKLSIFIASTPMRENILLLAETKSKIAFLNGIDTHEGRRYDTYTSNSDVLYKVAVDILWVREEVNKLEEFIDKLQEELDTFNHATHIEV